MLQTSTERVKDQEKLDEKGGPLRILQETEF